MSSGYVATKKLNPFNFVSTFLSNQNAFKTGKLIQFPKKGPLPAKQLQPYFTFTVGYPFFLRYFYGTCFSRCLIYGTINMNYILVGSVVKTNL